MSEHIGADAQAVLDALAENAANVCGAYDALIVLVDGAEFYRVAHYGPVPARLTRVPLRRDSVPGVAILDRRVFQLEDALASEELPVVRARAEEDGIRSALAAPLLKDGQAVGAILIRRLEPGPFSDRQVELLRTFADLAVIAIQNSRLLDEVEARNRDLAAALEQQTATAQVLGIIARSPADVQPVLDAIAEAAATLCNARDAAIRLVEGDLLPVAASYGTLEYANIVVPNTRGWPAGRAVLDLQTVHVHDILAAAETEYPELKPYAFSWGIRTMLVAPLRREDRAIGAIVIRRTEVKPYSEREIALLETFADQAVIAIENARILGELREALDHQTATSEVLGIIASSPTEVQPVLDAIAEKAAQVCGATDASIRLVDGDELRLTAHYGSIPTAPERGSLERRSVSNEAIRRGRTVHVPDILAETNRFPDQRGVGGTRTFLSTPLLREGAPIGVINIRRLEVKPFTETEIALLDTFARQAVIAIENARLFQQIQEANRDLTEALGRQTATAEVLQTISRSAFDLQAVLNTVVENAARLCEVDQAALHRLEGDLFPSVATYHLEPQVTELVQRHPPRADRTSISGRVLLEGRPIQVADLTADPEYDPARLAPLAALGYRTFLGVPLLRDGAAIGVFILIKRRVEPFTDGQIAMIQTFADQAVIAIENARLLGELREALDHQTATSEVLGIIAGSPTALQPVLDTIAEKAAQVCGATDAVIGLIEGDEEYLAAHYGSIRLRDSSRLPLALRTVPSEAVRQRRTLHVPDLLAEAEQFPDHRRSSGARTFLATPLLREGVPIGYINIRRMEVMPFTETEIALLETFARQAVIAIENVRLFNDLREALERQTATAEVLRIISGSPTDLQPVFQAIAQAAFRLLDAHNVLIWTSDGRDMEIVAHHGSRETRIPGAEGVGYRRPVSRDSGSSAVALLERRTVHVPDILALGDEDYGSLKARVLASGTGLRALLAAPMWWEGEPVGVITVSRDEPRAFSEPEIALLETFASQAVIAMENVRLFEEIQEKSQQLELASQHKSDFLASMSHELRTPLNAILSFSEMLQEDARDQGDEGYLPDLEEIHAAGKHLLELINDVLDLSKIEAGRMDLYLERFEVAQVVGEAAATAGPLVERNGNTLQVECGNDVGEMVADRTRVRQSLLNLLSNAAKFTENGTVTLRVERGLPPSPIASDTPSPIAMGEGGGEGGTSYVTFTVADTGVGMTEEQMGRLFEAFSQADVSTSRRYGGTGLGLAITKRFCEMMGGTIEVASEYGVGSTFTIRLPINVGEP